jgi:pimeloyl-ACP methyl ester carboxylesterase
MGTLVDCASGASPARLARISGETQKTLLGDAINGVQFDICSVIGQPDLGFEFRSDLETKTPILLVSGSLDPRTPISNAEEVLSGLQDGRHFLLRGVSHDFDLGDESLLEYIQIQIGFLLGQEPGRA